jgi:ketol-acid reductoisomerase
MAVIYRDEDVSLDPLKGKRIAIIGYGSQGSAQAKNLRDSGLQVCVSDLADSTAWRQAEADGFRPLPAEEAAVSSEVIMMLVPDQQHGEVFSKQVLPGLNEGDALLFAHGFSVHYGQVVPPEGVDCLLVAPKGPGSLVRSLYKRGFGVVCLLAVFQDATGQGKHTGLAIAAGIGGARAGIIETTFAEETETDLFGEQAVLCGGLSALIKSAFETLVEAGYQPEIAYFECLHEIKQIADMIYVHGLQGMRDRISDTAKYGDLTRGPKIISPEVKKSMEQNLQEIRDGRFAREWLAENRDGRSHFSKMIHQDDAHQVEQIGQKLRTLMSWLKEI